MAIQNIQPKEKIENPFDLGRHLAVLAGPFLKGTKCFVSITADGKIVGCDRITCKWSGTDKFDAWFREQYNPVVMSRPIGKVP